MSLIEKIHESQVHGRRVRRLAELISPLVPSGSHLLDVGCGDGLLTSLIRSRCDNCKCTGLDVLVRSSAHIPVLPFDGKSIPFDDNSFDVVLFVDVLHHTDDPMVLLREARRVARKWIIIKDHTMNGMAAGATLRFMDRVGNARHGVNLPFNYWPLSRWHNAFAELRLGMDSWIDQLGLYPFPFDLLFGRSLHFVGRLEKM